MKNISMILMIIGAVVMLIGGVVGHVANVPGQKKEVAVKKNANSEPKMFNEYRLPAGYKMESQHNINNTSVEIWTFLFEWSHIIISKKDELEFVEDDSTLNGQIANIKKRQQAWCVKQYKSHFQK